MNKSNPISERRAAQAKELHAKGLTYDAIAAEMGIGRGNVHYYLNLEKRRAQARQYHADHIVERHAYTKKYREDFKPSSKPEEKPRPGMKRESLRQAAMWRELLGQ